jgi:hypothetical protein
MYLSQLIRYAVTLCALVACTSCNSDPNHPQRKNTGVETGSDQSPQTQQADPRDRQVGINSTQTEGSGHPSKSETQVVADDVPFLSIAELAAVPSTDGIRVSLVIFNHDTRRYALSRTGLGAICEQVCVTTTQGNVPLIVVDPQSPPLLRQPGPPSVDLLEIEPAQRATFDCMISGPVDPRASDVMKAHDECGVSIDGIIPGRFDGSFHSFQIQWKGTARLSGF